MIRALKHLNNGLLSVSGNTRGHKQGRKRTMRGKFSKKFRARNPSKENLPGLGHKHFAKCKIKKKNKRSSKRLVAVGIGLGNCC
jgi:hypothetical protein